MLVNESVFKGWTIELPYHGLIQACEVLKRPKLLHGGIIIFCKWKKVVKFTLRYHFTDLLVPYFLEILA